MTATAINKLAEELDLAIKPFWRQGLIVIAVFVAFFLVWGTLAPLESNVQAVGKIIPGSSSRTIQNAAQDGVIESILVSNGDEVTAGQVLIKLSAVQAQSHRDNAFRQLISQLANRDRLLAEELDQELKFCNEVQQAISDPNILPAITNQRHIFSNNISTFRARKSVATTELAQLKERVKGLEAQQGAIKKQLKIAQDHEQSLQKLLAQQLVARNVVLEAGSKVAELSGKGGEVSSQIIQTTQELAKKQLEFDNLLNERNLKISNELKDTLDRVTTLREEYRNSAELAQRTVIKAPISGVVYNLKFNTVGGVIGPGQPILQIVPNDDQLIIEAQLRSNDIDVVHLNQEAKVQITAFKSRFHPRIMGKVTYISPDVIADPQQQQSPMAASFYTVNVEVTDDELAKFRKEVELKPGMPAVAFIVTGSRSFTEYFLAPIIDSIHYTFRED